MLSFRVTTRQKFFITIRLCFISISQLYGFQTQSFLGLKLATFASATLFDGLLQSSTPNPPETHPIEGSPDMLFFRFFGLPVAGVTPKMRQNKTRLFVRCQWPWLWMGCWIRGRLGGFLGVWEPLVNGSWVTPCFDCSGSRKHAFFGQGKQRS